MSARWNGLIGVNPTAEQLTAVLNEEIESSEPDAANRIRLLRLALCALEWGADTVDPTYASGVLVDGWLLASVRGKACYIKTYKWWAYKDPNELFRKHCYEKKRSAKVRAPATNWSAMGYEWRAARKEAA